MYWNGYVYVPSADGNLYAFNAENGFQRWSYDTGTSAAGIVSSPVMYQNLIIVANEDGNVVAVDQSGALKWSEKLPTTVSSSPAVRNGLLMVGGDDGLNVSRQATAARTKVEAFGHEMDVDPCIGQFADLDPVGWIAGGAGNRVDDPTMGLAAMPVPDQLIEQWPPPLGGGFLFLEPLCYLDIVATRKGQDGFPLGFQ